MPTLVTDVGPILGLVSFAVFVVLLVLYILKAIEIRRIRRAAPFLAETNGRPNAAPGPGRGAAERRRGVAR